MQRFLVAMLSLVSAVFLLASGVRADDEGEMGRSAASMLSPPTESPAQPDARGEVVINPNWFMVKLEDVLPGVYSVQLDDGTGALVEIGTISVLQGRGKPEEPEEPGDGEGGDDDDDDDDDMDDDTGLGSGILKLSGDSLPFGAAAPADLGGRAIQVVLAEAVIVSGITPMVMVKDPTPKSGRCPLALPEPPIDEDASGVLKLESMDGRAVIKVHLYNLEPQAVYEILIIAPPPAEGDPLPPASLGQATANPGGNASFMVDTEKGDPMPFGVGDLAMLVGYDIQVVDPEGNVILVGEICPPQIQEPDDDEDDDDDDDACKSMLNPPEGAADADATGKVEFELDEMGTTLEIKIQKLEPRTVYGVSLTDPAEGGLTEAVGEITTNPTGRGSLEIAAAEGVTLPFGKASVEELAGFLVAVTLTTVLEDETTVVTTVLEGAVPAADCLAPDEDDDGDDGGAGGEVVEPMFRMIGEYDTPFLRGDSNSDLAVDIADPVHCLNFLFRGLERPLCMDAADANDDGKVDLSDPISTLMYLFVGSTQPAYPGPRMAGSDVTADILFCEDPGL